MICSEFFLVNATTNKQQLIKKQNNLLYLLFSIKKYGVKKKWKYIILGSKNNSKDLYGKYIKYIYKQK